MTHQLDRHPSTRPVVSRLHCHGTRQGGRACDRFLGYSPSSVRFARLAERAPAEPDGQVWVKCQDCKAWNVYEAVSE